MTRIEQAGGIAFRRDGDRVLVLLVKAKKDPSLWIFPKGHIEHGESASQAAVRETREEGGVDGDVVGPVGPPLEFLSGREPVRVQYFLIRATSEAASSEGREKGWFSVDEAMQRVRYDTARDLLAAANDAVARLLTTRRFS